MASIEACVKTGYQKVSQWLDPQGLKGQRLFAFYPWDQGRPLKGGKPRKQKTEAHSKHLAAQGRRDWKGGKITGEESHGETITETQARNEPRRVSKGQMHLN